MISHSSKNFSFFERSVRSWQPRQNRFFAKLAILGRGGREKYLMSDERNTWP
jgi:hypothetical protein